MDTQVLAHLHLFLLGNDRSCDMYGLEIMWPVHSYIRFTQVIPISQTSFKVHGNEISMYKRI